MMSALITKIVDNLQISLTKIHLRVENADPDEANNQFSMGITLQAIELYTTDKDWKRQFIDRSKQKKDKDKKEVWQRTQAARCLEGAAAMRLELWRLQRECVWDLPPPFPEFCPAIDRAGAARPGFSRQMLCGLYRPETTCACLTTGPHRCLGPSLAPVVM